MKPSVSNALTQGISLTWRNFGRFVVPSLILFFSIAIYTGVSVVASIVMEYAPLVGFMLQMFSLLLQGVFIFVSAALFVWIAVRALQVIRSSDEPRYTWSRFGWYLLYQLVIGAVAALVSIPIVIVSFIAGFTGYALGGLSGVAIAIVTPASEEVFAQEVDPENPAYELPASARPEDVIDQWRWNGSGWDTVPPKPSPFHRWEDGAWRWLEQLEKDRAKRAIDGAAEAARGKYITLGAGQAMEYMEAYQQALVKLSNPNASVPMVAADVVAGVQRRGAGRPVNNELDAAQSIVEAYGDWLQVGAVIRRVRLGGKALVEAASTQREVAELRDQVLAALASI